MKKLFLAIILGSILIYLQTTTQSKSLIRDTAVSSDSAIVIYNSCQKSQNKKSCYDDNILSLQKAKGIEKSQEILKSLQSLDPDNLLNCHLLAHKMSAIAVSSNPENWLDFIRKQDPLFCAGGFVHGAIEAHTAVDSSFKINEQSFPLICKQLDHQGEMTCAHILGHLLLVQLAGKIESVPQTCSQVLDPGERDQCYNGAFMENVTRVNLSDHGLAKILPASWETAKYYEGVCNSFPSSIATHCWEQMVHAYIEIIPATPKNYFQACSRSNNDDNTNSCYLEAMELLAADKLIPPKAWPQICSQYEESSPMATHCLGQLISAILSTSMSFNKDVQSLCLATTKTLRGDCFKAIGRTLSYRLKDQSKIAEFCADYPTEYKNDCLNSKSSADQPTFIKVEGN